jgi:hypothetical protein
MESMRLRYTVFALLLAPAHAGAQQRIDVTLGAGWGSSSGVPLYTHTYVPRVAFDASSGGTARHTLSIAGESGIALAGTLGLRLSSRVGLEARIATRSNVRGAASGPHALRLDYTAPQPPDNLPRPFTLERSDAWPDAAFRVRQVVLGVGLRVRAVERPGWALDLAAGPTLHRVSGRLDGLAFTDFRLGGHGVLFADTFRLGTELAPEWVAGVHLGATAVLPLSGRMRLAVDARWLGARPVTLRPRVDRILNAEEVLQQLTPADIAGRVTFSPLELRPSFASVSAGVRIAF